MFPATLVNPNNLTAVKWKVCGGKNKCFGYYSVTTFIKYISWGGGVYTGGNEIFPLYIIYHRLIQVLWVIFLFLPFHSYKTLQYF